MTETALNSSKLPQLCRLCGNAALVPAFHMHDMPKWNHRLLTEREVVSDKGIDLVMMCCEHCGFVMIPDHPGEDYYDDYVNAPSFSPQMREAQRQQATYFVNRFGLAGKGVLEVGSGDGSYLECLSLAGASAHGIEPSTAQRLIAQAKGLTVHAGYLSRSRLLDGAPFDAFVTRQVLEHVTDIAGFLSDIRSHLHTGSVGLVEVPNFERLLLEGRYFDFIPEHVNYFTPRTLRVALELRGFDVLETASAIDGEALCAFVQLSAKANFENARMSLSTLATEVARFVAESKVRGGEVAVWGAGGKGLSILAGADLRGVDYVLDSDPHKRDRFTPVSHLRVSHPDILRERNVQAVVITAPAYQREIQAILTGEYGFRGRIALLENGLRVVQERVG